MTILAPVLVEAKVGEGSEAVFSVTLRVCFGSPSRWQIFLLSLHSYLIPINSQFDQLCSALLSSGLLRATRLEIIVDIVVLCGWFQFGSLLCG